VLTAAEGKSLEEEESSRGKEKGGSTDAAGVKKDDPLPDSQTVLLPTKGKSSRAGFIRRDTGKKKMRDSWFRGNESLS